MLLLPQAAVGNLLFRGKLTEPLRRRATFAARSERSNQCGLEALRAHAQFLTLQLDPPERKTFPQNSGHLTLDFLLFVDVTPVSMRFARGTGGKIDFPHRLVWIGIAV